MIRHFLIIPALLLFFEISTSTATVIHPSNEHISFRDSSVKTTESTTDEFARVPAQQAPTIGPIGGTGLGISPAADVERYEKFEITFEVDASYTNPFDPDDISVDGYFISPNNETIRHPGFLYQEYNVSGIGDSEIYTANGDPVWKVRFAPQEIGTYQYYVQVTDGNGHIVNSSTDSFEVTDSTNPGFIRISTPNNRYFEFDAGNPFFGIGLNVGWWQFDNKRISTYQYYLNRMSEYQANMARVWMTNSGRDQGWILSIQDQNLGSDYNLEEAWAFDYILNMAKENNVYFLLTLDDVNQYTYNWNQNLYNTELGGPCDYRSAIFTNEEAKINQKRIFRYIIARWGYSPNIISWELFNEIDELQWSDMDHWDRQAMIDWHQEMAQYIKSMDAHRHLVNTSTGSFKTHPDIYEALPEMELAQIHFYYVPGLTDPNRPSHPYGQDIANLTRYYAHRVYSSVSSEPGIIGEYGILGSGWTASEDLAKDDQGVHLHNGLWSSLMSGSAATSLSWHWNDHKNHDTDWWAHYRGIANYFKTIDTTNFTVMKPLNVDFSLPSGSDDRPEAFSSTNNNFRVMGLQNTDAVYLWVQNTENTWWNYVHDDIPPPSPQSGTVTVHNLTPGKTYVLEHWDTYQGTSVQTNTLSTQSDGSLQITLSELISDTAIIISSPPQEAQQVGSYLPIILKK